MNMKFPTSALFFIIGMAALAFTFEADVIAVKILLVCDAGVALGVSGFIWLARDGDSEE